MKDTVEARETRRKIYKLLVAGKSQARVAEILNLTKPTVNEHAAALEAGKYIVRIKGRGRPILYDKGPNGPQLDVLEVRSSEEIYTRGVTQSSENVAKVSTGKVHHLKFKMNVLKEGDGQIFYREGRVYRNVQRLHGQVPWNGQFLTVELERSFKEGGLTTFYIYPPELDLTGEELPHYEEIAVKIVMEVSNFMMKNMGWRFALPELTDWQRHIGIDNPGLMRGVAEKYFMKSKDGRVWTSNSSGRAELETDEIARAQILIDLPGEVLSLRTTTANLVEDLKQIVEALTLAKEGMERVAEINGIQLRKEHKEITDRIDGPPRDPAFAEKDRRKDEGMMYR